MKPTKPETQTVYFFIFYDDFTNKWTPTEYLFTSFNSFKKSYKDWIKNGWKHLTKEEKEKRIIRLQTQIPILPQETQKKRN